MNYLISRHLLAVVVTLVSTGPPVFAATTTATNNVAPLTRSEMLDLADYYGQVAKLLQSVGTEYKEFEDLKTKADSGDAAAQAKLGWMYVYALTPQKKQDYVQARTYFEFASAQNNAKGLLGMALLHEGGYAGFSQNYKKALESTRSAAASSNSWAQWRMGVYHEDGLSVKKNPLEASKWYLLSASQSNRCAQSCLGFLYSLGRGVKQDDQTAASWFEKSASQQYFPAEAAFGTLCVYGIGCTRDPVKGIKLITRSACQGYDGAALALGQFHFEGKVVPEDFAEAYKWFIIAKAHGSQDADTYLRKIEKRKDVTKETLAEAKMRAKAFGLRRPVKLNIYDD